MFFVQFVKRNDVIIYYLCITERGAFMKNSTRDILLELASAVLMVALKLIECYQTKHVDN